jgi:cytochrome c553
VRRVVLAFVLLIACSDALTEPVDAGALDAGRASPVEPDANVVVALDAGSRAEEPLDSTSSGRRKPGFCARPGEDAVRDLFCAESAPSITRLRELQDQLGVNGSIRAPEVTQYDDAGFALEDPNTIVDVAVFMGHSTALSGRLVSPINPRAIVLGKSTVMTFQRGVQQVEIVAFRRDVSQLNFYLLEFEQACNATGCKPGDLYTPRIESSWLRVGIRDAEELKNTTFDCRQCHQRGRETPMLLMRELEAPWTHFFELDSPDYQTGSLPGVRGLDLVRDYNRAKGDEGYAGLAAYTLRHTFGVLLQNLVNRDQPVLFDAPKIEEERWPLDEATGAYPSAPHPSRTWQAAYEAFKRGDQLAMPHFDPRPTDPAKQAALGAAYQRYRSGELSADELPDLGDIFPDDPLTRAQIGLQNEPGASAPEALVQVCASCHNDVLDQTITRARFNVALERMSRAELDQAIERLQRDPHAAGAMPPPESRQLDAEARSGLIAYLRANQRSAQDDAFLQHAATQGMTGGAKP